MLDLQVFKELVLTFGDAVFLFYLSNNNQSEVCEEDTGKEAPAKPTIATPSVTRGNQATILLHSGRQPYPRHIRPASPTHCSQTNILAVFRQPFLPFQANSFRNSHQRHNQHSRDQRTHSTPPKPSPQSSPPPSKMPSSRSFLHRILRHRAVFAPSQRPTRLQTAPRLQFPVPLSAGERSLHHQRRRRHCELRRHQSLRDQQLLRFRNPSKRGRSRFSSRKRAD